MSENTKRAPGRKLVIYRAVLPMRSESLGALFTVGALRRFLRDCDEQGITDDAAVSREKPDAMFALDGAQFVAERVVDLDEVPPYRGMHQ